MKKTQNTLIIKRKIKEYKKRLNNLKNQGFRFSDDIYNELEAIEKKILQPSIPNKILKNKIPIVITIISLFSIIMILLVNPHIFDGHNDTGSGLVIKPVMNIDISNLMDGETVDTNKTILGTVYHSKNKNVTINITVENDDNIEHYIIKNVKDSWNHDLDISNYSNGTCTYSVHCWDGEFNSNTLIRQFEIHHTIKQHPEIIISSPIQGQEVQDILYMHGIIQDLKNPIKNVKIIIDKSEYEATFDVSNDIAVWRMNWDSTNVENGLIDIIVNCSFEEGKSYSKNVSVIVNNTNPCPLIQNYETPPFEGGDLYQIYLLDLCDIVVPGNPYRFEGLVRKKYDEDANIFLTIPQVLDKPDWVDVSFSESEIITPPNGEKYYFYVYVTIDDDAPMNEVSELSIRFVYGIRFLMSYDWFIQMRINNNYQVTYYKQIQTGSWN